MERRSGKAPSERPRRTALAAAVAYLSRREVSEKKLTDYLLRKGYSAAEAAAATARLRKENYLSDERVALSRARDLSARRGYWGRALAAHLAAQGIAEEARRMALESVKNASDPEALAREALERRYGKNWQQAPERRVAAFLQRRGYPGDLIAKLLREARRIANAPAGSDLDE